MKQQESGIPMVIVIGGIILLVTYKYLIKIKDFFSQKFHEISIAIHNFIIFANTPEISTFLLGVLGPVVIYLIYRTIKNIKNKIKSKKEKLRNLRQESEEIKKRFDKKLNIANQNDLINFIELLENKIKLCNEIKELSKYKEPLKHKLKQAKLRLEFLELKKEVGLIVQEIDAINNLEKIEKEKTNTGKDAKNIKGQAIEEVPKAPRRPTITEGFIDANKGFFKHSELSLEDIKYLVKKGYKEYYFSSILTNKEELYLIKPHYNESQQHFFLVCDIVNYIKKFTNKVRTFNTEKPDIVFEINNKKYALEIETGTLLERDKNKLLKKIESLNKNYGKNWFFVVTDKNIASQYSKLGETHDKRYVTQEILKIVQNRRTDFIKSASFLVNPDMQSTVKSPKKSV